MAKRKFAGGNPFYSRKKYRGTLFGGVRVPVKIIKQGFKHPGQIGGGGWVPAPINTKNPRYGAIPDKNRVVPVPIRRGLPNPRRRKMPVRISSQHNDLTIQNLGYCNVGKQMKKRCSARPEFRNIEQKTLNGPVGVTTVTQGRQLIDTLPSMMNGNWIAGATSAARAQWDTLPDSLYVYDEQTATDSGVTSSVAKIVDRRRFHLKHIIIDYGFLSMTTIPQLVDVYWITPTYDQLVSPIDLLNQMMINNADGQAAAGNANTTGTANATVGGAAKDNWGFNPWSLPEFRRAFKCLKKVKMTLNPGDQKHFRVKFNFNKTIRAEWPTEGRNRLSLKDITVWPMVVLKCGLVGIKQVADAESREVVFGSPKVGVVSNMLIQSGLFPIGNRQNFQRVYKGLVEDIAATDVLVEIDDNDAVNAPEKS